MIKLKIGDKAPEFIASDELGKRISINDYIGKKVILFFYPKDLTPGCTVEACNLRDNYSDLINKGFEIVGVSADGEKKHQQFIEKYSLPFHLISDVDKKVITDYGVWGPKKFMGKSFEGINRTTFVINEEGNIEKIITKVNTKNHADQIMEELKK